MRYKVGRNYPADLYNKVISNPATGFANKKPPGRPPVFDANTWDAVDGVVREQRDQKKPASAYSKEEIAAAVEACWDRLTPDILQKVAARVRRNAQNTFDLKGGNFYDE